MTEVLGGKAGRYLLDAQRRTELQVEDLAEQGLGKRKELSASLFSAFPSFPLLPVAKGHPGALADEIAGEGCRICPAPPPEQQLV